MNASNVLLTRPAEQAKDLAVLLSEHGAVPIVCPVIEIVQLIGDQELRGEWTRWRSSVKQGLVALTSARAVGFLVEAHVEIDQPCAAVGPRTRQAVEDAGWSCVDVDASDASSLASGLIRAGYGDADVWFPCSKKSASRLQDSLQQAGAAVTRINLYEPRANAEQLVGIAERQDAFEVIVFHSSSAVDAAVDAIGAERLAGAEVVCVGQSTASRAEQRGLRVAAVAVQPSDQAVLAAIDTVAPRSSIIGAT